MRLPTNIERALQEVEGYLASLPGQHAGTPRLRNVRYAIEDYMKENKLTWKSPSGDGIMKEGD